MIRQEEKERSFAHYGTPRKSGRYPWGSGGDPANKRNKSFLDEVAKLKKQGMTDAQIAKGMNMTRNELVAKRSMFNAQQKQDRILQAQHYKERGWSNVAIAERMGLNESSVRALLRPGEIDKTTAVQTTANMLKDQVDEKKMVDVGASVEHHVGVTRTRLDMAVQVLKEQGYAVENIKIQQLGTGKYTTMKVLATPGMSKSDIQRDRKNIRQITEHSIDHGRSFLGIQPPISVSSRKIGIAYKEDGGAKADGVIYVRPGVDHLRIGQKQYGQVRIMVDNTHYLKGMAVYKDDLPEGVDLVFNTNKSDTGRKKDVMNPLETDATGKIDLDNPFGSIVRQVHDANGKVSSAMNLVGSPAKEGSGEEGSWDTWSRSLPSQMLSKQDPKLATQQLTITYDRRRRELDEISSLTNPTVRKDLLLKFADQTDAAAVHLQAASMKRQETKVLMPVPSMKPTEVYAPTFRDGERVVLVRFPHGGTFEIPQLTVNNRNREAKRLLGSKPEDAIGIHHSVAQHLSGADFDGDTVLVIPNRGSVKHVPALKELQEFDPQTYKLSADSPIPRMSSERKQQEMGKISNLITDMTIAGAPLEERARAVKHSMVVIDAEKHNLDFKQSEKDHGIFALKEKYQGGKQAGAATLISRAGSPIFLPQREERRPAKGGPIDPRTGKKIYEPTGFMVPERKRRIDPVTGRRIRVDTGKMIPKTERHEKLAVTEDAFKLSSGTQMESIYASHSNRLKAMANDARKEAVRTKATPYSPSAKAVYSKEVDSLNSKLRVAEKNAPLERQAHLLGNSAVSLKRQANPDMPDAELKKIKQLALNEYRIRTGAGKTRIKITQREWDAIQAGALSKDKLERVLKESDIDTVRALALPKQRATMSSTMQRRATSMLASGYTQAEVADALGVGLTTLKVSLSE